MTEPPEGFYHLRSPYELEPVLVRGYKCADRDGAFVFGFNAHDGGGILPLSDLSHESVMVPVTIKEAE
jgi:hypothetical protein